MNYFDIEKQLELKRVLEEWHGTPFKHRTAVKGLGCDCVHFAVKVFEEIGLLNFSMLSIPDYPMDWHLHNTREALCEAIEKYLKVEKYDMNVKLINGDIILSHYGKASSHAGIFFDDYVHQAINNIGVRKIHISDKGFKKQMKFFYRVIK